MSLFPDLPPPPPPPSLVVQLEAVLFVASEALSLGELSRILAVDAEAVQAAVGELATSLAGRGLRLQRNGDEVQLVSAPEAAAAVARLIGAEPRAKLSNAALEVLAIIAYRQPLTRAQIEAVRGVDSSGVIRALLARELIAEAGRLETVGRPVLYATTASFLQQFGLNALSELPHIEAFGDEAASN